MSAVAKRRILAVLASAEMGGYADCRGVLLGSEHRTFVATVAVRLIGSSSACAPMDRFAGLKHDGHGGFLNYCRFHEFSPKKDAFTFT
jgi:hypothetical protein